MVCILYHINTVNEKVSLMRKPAESSGSDGSTHGGGLFGDAFRTVGDDCNTLLTGSVLDVN